MNRYRSSAGSLGEATQYMSVLAGRAVDSTEFKKRYMFIRLLLKVFAFVSMVSMGWCLYLVYASKESFLFSITDEEEEDEEEEGSVVTKKKLRWNKTSTQMNVSIAGMCIGVLGVFYSLITISRLHPVDRALLDTREAMRAAATIPVLETVDTVGAEIKTSAEEVVTDTEKGRRMSIDEIDEEVVRVASPVTKGLKKRRRTSDQMYKKWVEKTLAESEREIKKLKKEGDENGVQDVKDLVAYLVLDMKTKMSPPKLPSNRSFNTPRREFSGLSSLGRAH